MKSDDTESFELFKEQLLNEWMKENPPFDNNKESFEDYENSESQWVKSA